MKTRALALFIAALALAGCGTQSQTTTSAPPTTTASGQMELTLYYFDDNNALVPVKVPVPRTEAVATAALNALLAGAPQQYVSGLHGSNGLESVAVSNGVASVRFTGPPLSHAAMGQVVYTLTQFPTITSVDGETRADFVDLTARAPIFVERPLRDAEYSSPVHARGTADVFEGTLAVDVYSNGKKLRTQMIQATAGTGTRGTWSASIDLPPGPARLVFYEPSAENGRPLHTAEVDLTIR